LVDVADGHFLVWKLHQHLNELKGLRWNIAGNAYRASFQIEVRWQQEHEQRPLRLELTLAAHHPIHRDEYCEWLVAAIVSHIESGTEPPSLDGEPGYELRSHDGRVVRVLIDHAPTDADALLGGKPDVEDDDASGEEERDTEDSEGVRATDSGSFNFPIGNSSDLYVIYGYTVAKKAGLRAPARRRILEEAINDRGAQYVAGHLAGLIKRNGRGRSAIWFHEALRKWSRDLEWIKENYEVS
jgi:hypothetical protein